MEEKETLVRTIETLNASIAVMLENHKKEVDVLNERIKELTAQVAWLNRQLFGRKSESLDIIDASRPSRRARKTWALYTFPKRSASPLLSRHPSAS